LFNIVDYDEYKELEKALHTDFNDDDNPGSHVKTFKDLNKKLQVNVKQLKLESIKVNF